ncbi:MAG: site-specific integrase, partial [Acidimicrobiales bacterium]
MTQNADLEPAPEEAVTAGRHAAEVLPELAARPPAADGAGALPPRLADLEAKVAAAISRGRSAATLRAYRSDWADFTTWCATVGLEALPAAPATVAGYVAEMASPPDDRSPAAVSTITRRLAAIGEGHKVAGHPNPCTEVVVRETMKGIRRILGVAPRPKKAVATADVRAAVGPLGTSLLDTRDRLVLLLGFAGAMRRSELVGLDVADVEEVDEGLLVHLGRSKTDQEGAGRRVEVVYGTEAPTCPVRAWRAWLAASGITDGPVFRPVDRHGRLGERRLSAQAVAIVVKRHMAGLGYRSADFAGHSLRRGHATTAARNGASERTIMRTTGHTSTATVRAYVEDGELFSDPASKYL